MSPPRAPGLRSRLVLSVAAACTALAGCTSGPDRFIDLAAERDLTFVSYTGDNIWYLIDSFGAGLAAGDFDGDGRPDLMLLTGSAIDERFQEEASRHRNALWRNVAAASGITFADVTARAGVGATGWSNGAVFADYDGDGDLDLFVARHGPNQLWRNEGDGTFTEQAAAAGLADPRWTTAGVFADFDGDGDLDLYTTNYCEFDVAAHKDTVRWFTIKQFPHYFEHQPNALYRNDGDGTFTDVTLAAAPGDPLGVGGTGRSLMALATDHDGDGDLDLLVANDIGLNDLYRNDGGLRFSNVGIESGFSCDAEGNCQASMGIAAGDIDHDGDLDYVASHYGGEYHTLYVNQGGGALLDDTRRAGLVTEATLDTVGWGVGLHDMDLDGHLDIVLVNGHVITDFVRRGMLWHWGEDAEKLDDPQYLRDNPQMADAAYNLGADQPKLLFLGRGDGTFVDASAAAGPTFVAPRMSRGAAFADFDLDGRLDLAVSNKNQPAQILLNRLPRKGRFLGLELRGRAPNTFAVGASVTVRAGGLTHRRDVSAGTSYCSGSDYLLHVGLGAAQAVDQVLVRWPGGAVETFSGLEADAVYRLTEGGPAPVLLRRIAGAAAASPQ